MLKVLIAGLILAGSIGGVHVIHSAASDPFLPMSAPTQVASIDPGPGPMESDPFLPMV